MQKQTKRRPEQEQPPAVSPPGGSLDQTRAESQRLLNATDAALARALSGDAERFLVECRQQGGQ